MAFGIWIDNADYMLIMIAGGKACEVAKMNVGNGVFSG